MTDITYPKYEGREFKLEFISYLNLSIVSYKIKKRTVR